MVSTGDYFTPTINKIPYYNKPLLSYWAILSCAGLAGGVTEWAARMPSALAAIITVFLTFIIGRKLFGRSAGFISAVILATSVMYVTWARTASADVLNMMAVWVVLWLFLSGANQGKTVHLIGLYFAAAAGSFLKGPVAAVTAFAAIGFYSMVCVLLDLRERGFNRSHLIESIGENFKWVLSLRALLGMAVGIAVFLFLLFLPVLLAGDWGLPQLMWRENVTRFFQPFDHIDPPQMYFQHIMVYFAPWSLVMLAALWDARRWQAGESRRIILAFAAGIFIFLIASGSRRSYYLLPLLPALAIITGKAISDWLYERHKTGNWHVKWSVLLTVCVVSIAGLSLGYLYFKPGKIPRGILQLPAVAVVFCGGILALVFLLKRKQSHSVVILTATIILAELWFFTAGAAAAEKERGFRPFCREAATILKDVPGNQIALYKMSKDVAKLFFYIKRTGFTVLHSREAAELFFAQYPDGFILAGANHVFPEEVRQKFLPPVESILIHESASLSSRKKRLCLLRSANAQSSEVGTDSKGSLKKPDKGQNDE
jgi:4-amino-4-deoxy-L-arabinose transferase-like glycosyltransferase